MRPLFVLLPFAFLACDGTATIGDAPDGPVPRCAIDVAPNPPSFVTPTQGELLQPEDTPRFEATVATELGEVRHAEFEVQLLAQGRPVLNGY
ncbi:MAG: hypothetical protein GY811_29120 [Myxococcales bacterium]|nr:hypothetical protein [Myxococcales bacterium]